MSEGEHCGRSCFVGRRRAGRRELREQLAAGAVISSNLVRWAEHDEARRDDIRRDQTARSLACRRAPTLLFAVWLGAARGCRFAGVEYSQAAPHAVGPVDAVLDAARHQADVGVVGRVLGPVASRYLQLLPRELLPTIRKAR